MIGYLAEASDWSKMLDGAGTLDALRKGVKEWAPFVDDAQAIVDVMGDAALTQFYAGLKKERKGKWAGEKWQVKFGAVLLPAGLMRGIMAAEQYKVPLGTALIQMQKAGLFRQEVLAL